MVRELDPKDATEEKKISQVLQLKIPHAPVKIKDPKGYNKDPAWDK